MLIVGRAVAGMGGAGLFSGALIILANTVPLRQRPGEFSHYQRGEHLLTLADSEMIKSILVFSQP